MSQNPTHKVVFIQDHYQIKDPKSGLLYKPNTSTLYIRSYQPTNKEKQHKKVSLKIKLKNTDIKAYFDERKQRFKDIKKFPEGRDYNEKIEDELKKLGIYQDLSYIPDKRKSFLKYWQNLIDTTSIHGTRIKHKVIKTKLEKYLTGQDLLFSEINTELLRSIYHYFKMTKDPKKLSIGTANHYMKVIHSVINIARKQPYYVYHVDPFTTLKYNKAEEPELEGKVIPPRDLKRLLTLEETGEQGDRLPEYLEKYRLALLFQLFSNGMRVSDMLTLRWSNIESGDLRYSMVKTKKSMIVPININLVNIIARIANDEGEALAQLNRIRVSTKTVVLIDKNQQLFTLLDIEKKLDGIANSLTLPDSVKHNFKQKGYVEIDSYLIDPKDLNLYYTLKNARTYIVSGMEKVVIQTFWIMNQQRKNEFMFPFLDNKEFKDVNNLNNITEDQYKKIKHNTIVYNRNLKKIAEFYRINVNLTSYVARHSFASYLLSMGNVNTFDIQKLLGHKSIQITDKYLQKHFNLGKLDDTNRRLSSENTIR